MADYPNDKISRQKRRAAILHKELDAAHQRAARAGRSHKCAELGNHAPRGCRNDGSTCICECHDPASIPGVSDGRT